MSLNQTKNEKTMNMGYSTQQASVTQQSMTKYSEDDYSNYIDSSDLVVEYYKKTQVSGLESQFLQIDNWISRDIKNPEDNVPLVIVANEGVGKKTLLVKWMEFHQQNDNQKQPDIILPHFATTGGNNSNYFFAIYQFLIKLREILDVKQKVELLEEKLRSFFAYWLGVCHDSIERQIIDDKPKVYNKIILLIEGIDHFVDPETSKEAAVAFWLPRFFPTNIRVICTAEKNSEALAYFQRNGNEPMYIQVDQNVVNEQIARHLELQLLISDELKDKHAQILQQLPENAKISMFIATYLTFFLPCCDSLLDRNVVEEEDLNKLFSKVDYEKLQKCESQKQIYELILEIYKKAELINFDNLLNLLQVCCISQKGLTLVEIQRITGISDEEWRIFLVCFKDFFIFYKDLWILNNDSFKKFVKEQYMTPKSSKQLHLKIAAAMEKTQNSIRKLEEQTFHLFKAGTEGYFQLKEIISTIENFLLLFNPNNKYDLCRYWQALDEQGFDPVIEYNKAIEGFEMHYHPNPEDVFRIIVQISRFLKEFSDFETYYTPEFRHPPIKGTIEELDDIGLLRELHQLGIYLNKEGDDLTSMENKMAQDKQPKSKIQEGIRKLKYGGKDEQLIQIEQSNMDKKTKMRQKMKYLKEKRKEKEEQLKEVNERKLQWEGQKRKNQGVINKILSKVEQLNVDIPVNRQYFRDYYVQQLQKIMNEEDNSQNTNDQNNDNNMGMGGQQNEKEQKKGQKLNATQLEQQNAENQLLLKKQQNEQEINEQFIEMHKNDDEFNNKNRNNKNNFDSDSKTKLIQHSQLKEYYNLKQRETTDYYYKRWIWIQYPWACLSLKQDYSSKMKKCFSSATEYMSVTEEKKFTKQALKIAIEAKLKKQSMYQQKKNVHDQSSIIQANMSRISHNSSLPQLHHHRSQTQLQNNNTTHNNNLLGKSQTLSRIDPNESQELPSKLKNYNKTMTNKRTNDSVQFFITEEYTSVPNINREIEKIQNSPQKDNKKVTKLLNQEESMVQDTQKVLGKSKKFKEKSQLYDPMPSLNESRKLDSILPRLKQSITGHNSREIYLLEQQSFDMKNTLNNLVSQNTTMAKSLKHLKRVQDIQKEGIDGSTVINAKKRLEDLEKKIQDTQNNYYFCVMQIERFKTISRLSEENKKQNQEWIRYLNYLLGNITKMINWEKEGIKKCQKETQELLKINDEYQKVFEEKMKNHDRLIQQIKQNLVYKKNVDGVFGRSDNVIERSAFQQVEKMKSDQQTQDIIRKQKERQDKNQNKQRDIGNQLEEQRLEYEKLKEVIDIQKQDYKQSPQFQEFMASQEKEADLRSILLERDYQIYDLQKLLEQKQNKLEILEKAYKQQQKNDQQQREKEAQQQEQEQQKTNQNQEKQQQQPQKQKTQQDQTPKNAEGESNNQNQSENKNTEENKQEGEENQQQQEQQQNSEKKEEQKSENNEQQQQENQEQEKPQNQENQDQQQQQNENQEKSEQKQQQNEEKQQSEVAAEDSEEVDYDEEDPNMPADPDHLQIYFDGKANQHYKIEQTRLAVIGIIQTSQQKLNLKQSSNVKETIRFDVEEMKSALQEKLDLIKSKLDPEDYENFMGGTYDKNKMYKGLVDDITEYGYEEEPGDDAFEESSVNDY